MTEDIKIINADETDSIEPDLPEAGWKRREELAERKDKLEQAAEEAGEQIERYAFDRKKVEPEWEILQHMDELTVEPKVEGYNYVWCYEGLGGRAITKKARLGWVVVQSDMPECPSLKDARGYRKIGDVILMRIPTEKFVKLKQYSEYKRLMQQKGVGAALREMGDKYRQKGFIVHDDANDVTMGGRGGKSVMDVMEGKARQTGARRTAMRGVDSMLRKGNVPDLPGKGGA